MKPAGLVWSHHPKTLASTANPASTYRNQGRWDEAETLGVQVTDILKSNLGADHPETLAEVWAILA